LENLLLLPHFLFLLAAFFAYILKGEFRKFSNIFFSLLVFIILIFYTRPQISQIYNFAGFEIVFFNADRTSLFISYIFAFMAMIISFYSMHVEEKSFHVTSMVYVFGAMGMVFAGDFLTFFFFGEILLVAGTILICYKKEKQAVKAALRYFIIHLFGSSILLAGILINYSMTNTMNILSPINELPAILILVGVGVNAAFIPFHVWLPDAYTKAPFEASLLLSVFTTKGAIYSLARLFPGTSEIAYMGAAMALFGVVMALQQSNARKLLSYHVISQVGFMVAGVGMGTFLGVDGALYHAFNHIIYKSLLFMCIGAVIFRTGKENLSEMGGSAKSMPMTTIACIIAALSISGVPFFNGYASKAILYEASYGSSLLLWSLKIASLGTFISFCKFTYYGFIRNKHTKVIEAPLNMTIPMLVLSILCILGGIYPRLVTMFLPYNTEIAIYVPSKIFDAIIFTSIAGILFFLGMNQAFKPHPDKIISNTPNNNTITQGNNKEYFSFAYIPFPLRRFVQKINDWRNFIENSFVFDTSLLILTITIAILLLIILFS